MVAKMNRRGQITIFIIIAVLLVAAILLVFVLYNNRTSLTEGVTFRETASEYEDCINTYISEADALIFENSGFISMPGLNYFVLNTAGYYRQEELGEIPYLCYVGINYARCVPQAPLMIDHLEAEIKDYVEPFVQGCFNLLEGNLEDNSYEVDSETSSNFVVEVRNGVILTSVDKVLTQRRAGEEERFESFSSRLSSPLYSIGKVVQEIVNQESSWCNSDYVEIMAGNPRIQISKFVDGNNIRIYTVLDTVTKKGWRFAIRGCKLSTPS